MLRKTTKFIGRGVAFIASCASFTVSLAAYPFMAVFLLGAFLFKIWDSFFTLRKAEQQRANIANVAAMAMSEEGGTNAADFLFQRKNSTQYDSALVGKRFLRQVYMSFVSPFLAMFVAIPTTFLFAKKNAETVYSTLSTATDFDVDLYPAPTRHTSVPSIGTNSFYQEPRQQTLLHTQRATSTLQANDDQSNDHSARRNRSCTIS